MPKHSVSPNKTFIKENKSKGFECYAIDKKYTTLGRDMYQGSDNRFNESKMPSLSGNFEKTSYRNYKQAGYGAHLSNIYSDNELEQENQSPRLGKGKKLPTLNNLNIFSCVADKEIYINEGNLVLNKKQLKPMVLPKL